MIVRRTRVVNQAPECRVSFASRFGALQDARERPDSGVRAFMTTACRQASVVTPNPQCVEGKRFPRYPDAERPRDGGVGIANNLGIGNPAGCIGEIGIVPGFRHLRRMEHDEKHRTLRGYTSKPSEFSDRCSAAGTMRVQKHDPNRPGPVVRILQPPPRRKVLGNWTVNLSHGALQILHARSEWFRAKLVTAYYKNPGDGDKRPDENNNPQLPYRNTHEIKYGARASVVNVPGVTRRALS